MYEIEHATGKGPQLFSAQGSWVAPDMLGFRDKCIYFFEAKSKSVFSWHFKGEPPHWDTGIDLRHYCDYLEVGVRTNLLVYLLFLHQGAHSSQDDIAHGAPAFCPTGLFGGELSKLASRECHRSSKHAQGMVYWKQVDLACYARLQDVGESNGLLR